MKNIIIFLLLTFFSMCSSIQPGWAEEGQKVKLNASDIKKAAEIIRRNQAIFKDPEMMKRYANLINALKEK